jgi:hypothetical protein
MSLPVPVIVRPHPSCEQAGRELRCLLQLELSNKEQGEGAVTL